MKPLALLPLLAALLVVEGGIMMARYAAAPLAQPKPDVLEVQPAYAVISAVANVYAAPDVNSKLLGHASQHAILWAVGSRQSNWRFVMGDGWEGWVLGSDLTPSTFMAQTQTTVEARLE